LGRINDLLGVLPCDRALANRYSSTLRRNVRSILHIPNKTPNALIDAEVRILPFHATVAANNVRLLESIKHNPFQQTCAVRLLRFQLTAEPRGT